MAMSVKAKLRQGGAKHSAATAEQGGARYGKAKAKPRVAKHSDGIVTYRGAMRGIVTKNSDGQAWHSIAKALRSTTRTCKGIAQ